MDALEVPAGVRLRAATLEDVPLLAGHRRLMFESFVALTEEHALALERTTEQCLRSMIPTGSYVGRAVEVGGAVVASGGVLFRDLLPRPNHVDGAPEAIIVSMWTEHEHRGRGFARLILQSLLDCCRERGVSRVVLHASPRGRPIYEGQGFVPTTEMRLKLPGE